MIDDKHRLRPERVHKYKANLFRDIKFLFVNVWNEIFRRETSESSYHDQHQDSISNYGIESNSDSPQSTSVSSSNSNEHTPLIKRKK
jgi:hypothetical protein